MNTLTYTVPNISCAHCVHTIKVELLDAVPGVKSVEGDPAIKRVTILYDDPAIPEAIEALLAEIDYPVDK